MDHNYCQNCGKICDAGGKYCPFCGSMTAPAQKKICSSCRNVINKNDIFCRWCGKKCEPVKDSFITFYELGDEELALYSYSDAEKQSLTDYSDAKMPGLMEQLPDEPPVIKDQSQNIKTIMSQLEELTKEVSELKNKLDNKQDISSAENNSNNEEGTYYTASNKSSCSSEKYYKKYLGKQGFFDKDLGKFFAPDGSIWSSEEVYKKFLDKIELNSLSQKDKKPKR